MNMDTINGKIGVIDFGGQYAHLISSRIRHLGAYTEILSNEESPEKYREFSGLIFSGGPSSVYEENAPDISDSLFSLNIPILGICYGHQLLVKKLGGKVSNSYKREYGRAGLSIFNPFRYPITSGLSNKEVVWMSHGDEAIELPEGFVCFAESENCKNAGIIDPERRIIGIQFHPEVTHTRQGLKLLSNFISLCGLSGSWDLNQFLAQKIKELQEEIPAHKKVFMLVSGGVDSTVSYILLVRALGEARVKGLLIDTGFMRKDEVKNLQQNLSTIGVHIYVSDESQRFYKALEGKTDPEEKRKIMGKLFLEARAEYAAKMNLNPQEWMLGQGTIYPDTIESGGTRHSHNIKTHHNRVQEILELMEKGELVEPIKELYKDEVRGLGILLGVDKEWTMRHPFPGPGLGVRMIATPIDTHIPEEDKLAEIIGSYPSAMVSVLPVQSVGVQGDKRSYRHCAALNDFSDNWDTYNEISTRITNEITEINRVVFAPFQRELPPSFYFNPIFMDKKHSDILREADAIVQDKLIQYKLLGEIWQFPVVLLPIGKEDFTFSIVLRPVESQEAMTANFYCMNREFLKDITHSLLSHPNISYVFYDLTHKPPGTIEWE